jgi:peptidoglycan hydrolase CwlO-like protein
MNEIEKLQEQIYKKWQLIGQTRQEIIELEKEVDRLKGVEKK